MTRELRQSLEQIPHVELEGQENFLIQINLRQPHSIQLIDQPELFIPGEYTYNCYAFALNLFNSDVYRQIVSDLINPEFANSDFIIFLLDRKELIEIENARNIDHGIIIYFRDDRPVHAGKVRENIAISKWRKGLLFNHDIFEVPESYGNEYKIFQSLTENEALQLFYVFAETRGWRI